MSRFNFVLIALVLLFLTTVLVAQDQEQFPDVEVFHDRRGIPMVLVPPGEFQSGIEVEEAVNQCLSLRQDEGFPPYDPAVICDPELLALSRIEALVLSMSALYVDQYEVSRSDYIACVEADICSDEPLMQQSREPLNAPVQYATYVDASVYCAWREARLPTAFEWEYIARGPENHTFAWGNEFDGNLTNHCDVNCPILGDAALQSVWNDGYSEVAPVDAFETDQSWASIYNLSGNVEEWTSTYGWQNGSRANLLRVIKGGGFDSYPYQTAGWYTTSQNLTEGRASLGFRCVRTTEP